jgi:hypothetical protein
MFGYPPTRPADAQDAHDLATRILRIESTALLAQMYENAHHVFEPVGPLLASTESAIRELAYRELIVRIGPKTAPNYHYELTEFGTDVALHCVS